MRSTPWPGPGRGCGCRCARGGGCPLPSISSRGGREALAWIFHGPTLVRLAFRKEDQSFQIAERQVGAMPGPEDMAVAVAGYITALHGAYLAQANTFGAAVRGRMPLLAGGSLTVAAVGARNLHLLATREGLALAARAGGGATRFVARSGLVAAVLRPGGGAGARVDRRAEGAGVRRGAARAGHHHDRLPRGRPARCRVRPRTTPGTSAPGWPVDTPAAARDFETIRSRVPGREHLVDELIGAAAAGLPHAQALLARLSPRTTRPWRKPSTRPRRTRRRCARPCCTRSAAAANGTRSPHRDPLHPVEHDVVVIERAF